MAGCRRGDGKTLGVVPRGGASYDLPIRMWKMCITCTNGATEHSRHVVNQGKEQIENPSIHCHTNFRRGETHRTLT